MPYRSILVHLDDPARSSARLVIALRLVKAFDAQLVGVFAQPSYEIYPFAAEMVPADFVQQSIEQRAQTKSEVEKQFREAVSASGQSRSEFRAPPGEPYRAAAMHARLCDLAIVGQPQRDAYDRAFASELVHSLVMDSGRPVLVVPQTPVTTLGERVLIAWKNTREAARAVSDALPFLTKARSVRAVSIAPESDETGEDRIADRKLADYLSLHGVNVECKRIAGADADAGELLLSSATETNADLIVMGGYSRRRIRELIWGGVTRMMLRSTGVPVFMAH
ncbi:MAG TPA: universal stress protein [Casimicrobiaceae bacterium]|nr:universal stress protein [Casimicrobiaceae bacterium]